MKTKVPYASFIHKYYMQTTTCVALTRVTPWIQNTVFFSLSIPVGIHLRLALEELPSHVGLRLRVALGGALHCIHIVILSE